MFRNKCRKTGILTLFSAAVVFTLSSCKKEPPEESPEEMPAPESSEETSGRPSESLIIELGVGVGPVKFGMSKEEVIKRLGQPDKIETVMPDLIRLDYISSRGLLLGLNTRVGVNYIKCYSERYPGYSRVTNFAGRTKKGIVIGASQDQIIDTYGQPDQIRSKGQFTILYYEDLAADMILVENGLVGIKMEGQR